MLLLLPLWVAVAFMASNAIIAGILWLLNVFHIPLEDYIRPSVEQTLIAVCIYAMTIAIVIGIPYLVRQRPTSLSVLGLSRLPSWMDIGLAPVGFISYMILVTVVFSGVVAVFPNFPIDQVQDTGFEVFGSRSDNILAFSTLVVLAPLAEETLFRGYLYGKLKAHVPAIMAALVTSLLFAVAHFQLNVGVDVFVMSLVLCGLRSLTGSIWAGVLVHVIKNAVAYYLLFVRPLIGG